MLKKTIPVLFLLIALLTACGPQATPTMNPADVQGTAVAAAWTVVAETQAAIPTATPLPPTATASITPPPTFTPASTVPTTGAFSTPTQNPFALAPTSTSASADSCTGPLDVAEAGPTKRVRVENQSGGSIILSLNLTQKNSFGQCGALSWSNIEKGAKFIINIPNGSWYAYAWVTLKGGQSSTAAGSFFFGNSTTQDLNRLLIGTDVISLVGP